MLTPAQQAAIDYHLRQLNRLTNESLIAELTDHYNSAIEEKLAQGMAFEPALTAIQQAFGGRKSLLQLERHYNRVTIRQYDTLWLGCVREQLRWPHVLLPIFIFVDTFWVAIHTARPTTFSVSSFTNGLWNGFTLGALLGLTLKFIHLVLKQPFKGNLLSAKAIYLATRFLPIAILLYGTIGVLMLLSQFLPAYVYELMLSGCTAAIVTNAMSYSRFYQLVLKNKPTLY